MSAARKDAGGENGANLENYQLILDTLDRSNVLLWWAKVRRENGVLAWKIRTPPQLRVDAKDHPCSGSSPA